ncbi:unnamed protein product [Fraxinus pennsylvanica]|uniref:Uncharacterized protein n=1 Tax=Fraxinus pennsylvanica TaxID=56036 RepID=A0AAD2AEQ2_9LAMI|nr:unnamed protein product [Fraxinus pennsylvanica]
MTFSAEKNQLLGPLPFWLDKWNQVDSILLPNNQFSERIPVEIGNCFLLSHISLGSILSTSEIHKDLCNAISLTEIELDHNFLTMNIDDTFPKCNNLTQFVLFHNQMGKPAADPKMHNFLPAECYELIEPPLLAERIPPTSEWKDDTQ